MDEMVKDQIPEDKSPTADTAKKEKKAGGKKQAARTARQQAREAVFCLLFETEYHEGESPEDILERAGESREVNGADNYIRDTYFGVCVHAAELDEIIGRHAKGWRTGRLSRVSRSIIRLSVYEMKYRKDIPYAISINEAVELSKRYDAPQARAFINGVLNAVKEELEAAGDADHE